MDTAKNNKTKRTLTSARLRSFSPIASERTSCHFQQNDMSSPIPMATSAAVITTPINTRPMCDTYCNDSSIFYKHLLGDVVVACGVTLGIAPFMTVVDKAIVQQAAGTHTVLQSSRESLGQMIRRPVSYVRSPMFLMMWGVYAATYTAANSLNTMVEFYSDKKTKRHSNKTVIFLGTTLVNSSSSLMKDRAYAKMFGTIGAAPRMPLVTYGLWATRDCMVIGSSFILPSMLAGNEGYRRTIAQILFPVLTQAVAGPVQLLGLDFYNRPHVTLTQRIALVRRNFSSILVARVARILPAYGIGGVGNTHLRNMWREKICEKMLM